MVRSDAYCPISPAASNPRLMFQTGISVDILFVSLPVKALPTSDTLDVLSEEHLCHLDEAGEHWRPITTSKIKQLYLAVLSISTRVFAVSLIYVESRRPPRVIRAVSELSTHNLSP